MHKILLWTLLALMLAAISWAALRPGSSAPPPVMAAAEVGHVDPQDLRDEPATREAAAARRDPQNRLAYTQRLNTETDLLSFSAELERLAEAGDADAAAKLVELHEYCAGALHRAQDPPHRCDALGPRGDDSVRRLRAEAKRWLARAQQLGDPASQLKLRSYFGPPAGAPATPQELQLREAVTTLIAENDYAPLLRANLLLAELSNHYRPEAFERAICAVRAPCRIEVAHCQMANRCRMLNDYPESGVEGRTPRETRILAMQQQEIEAALRQGDLSAIWRVSDPGDGG
ncbi:MAG: hypothetical protein AB7E72_17915 [Lysobacterales bacterium]